MKDDLTTNASNEAESPVVGAVSCSGYINNPKTVDEIGNNANIQIGNIEYYLSIKDYQSALIKANCLVTELQNIIALKIGS